MLNLSNEQKTMFALLGANSEINPDTDWEEVETEALQQAVYLQAYNSEKNPRVSAWPNAMQSLACNLKSFYAATELNRIMKAHGIRYVILKGLASAAYYPEYMHRILGDCDFLIDPEQKETVRDILLEAGYELCGEGDRHHWTFIKPGQELEMHFEIPGVPDGQLGEAVQEYIRNILDETITYVAQGHEINVPLPRYHGLILLLHMQHHMLLQGVGLRHLLDWCLFVDRTHKEPFWENDLLPILKRIGALKYAQAMTKTGSIYLGTACPDWCESMEESLCDDVMNDILVGGNFGRKNPNRSAAGLMISQQGKAGTNDSVIQNLWASMRVGIEGYHHKTLKKYPILYPVFIIEFVVRRFWRVITGKRSSILSNQKYVSERKSVYDRFELFQDEESIK